MIKEILKILLGIGLILIAVNFVSASDVDYAVEIYDNHIKDIDITEAENTVLKNGGGIKKTMTIKKHFKIYKKTKKLTFKNSHDSKKLIKKQIKRAVKRGGDSLGCQYYYNIKQGHKLLDSKIVSVKFKAFYKNVEYCDGSHNNEKFYKVTVKYKPFKKIVTKSKQVTATLWTHKKSYGMLLYPLVNIEYKNPFTHEWDHASGEAYTY